MTIRRSVRHTSIGTWSCSAPDELFARNWDDVPKELQDQVPENGIACDGGGYPGPWYMGCNWGFATDKEEDEEELI